MTLPPRSKRDRTRDDPANLVYTAGDVAALIEMRLEVHQGDVTIDRERLAAWAGCLRDADDALKELRQENFALAANQCKAGYSGEAGDHMCEYQDVLRDIANQYLPSMPASCPEDGLQWRDKHILHLRRTAERAIKARSHR